MDDVNIVPVSLCADELHHLDSSMDDVNFFPQKEGCLSLPYLDSSMDDVNPIAATK